MELIDFFAIRRRFSLRGAFCYTAVHAMHSSWTYHGSPLCPIHLCSLQKVLISWQACHGFHLLWKLSIIFIVATLIPKVLFLICTATQQVEHNW